MIGTLLGNRYEILEKIGEGGTAEVYKARCQLLNRMVAVKVLKAEFLNDNEFVDKFKREATSAASISHNNIVNIYDVGSHNNINYIVMEYVKGKTLKEIIIENGRLDYNRAVEISIQIAKALECAHKNNVVHRDIKPQNILVTDEDMVKVTDFGIAKASSSVTITNTSKVMGSAHYFSPEQAKGSFVDCRTDIYSLGVVLYEMVVGRVPFDAESPVSIALKHIQEPVVPPKQINSNIPEGLNKVIIKSLEKDPIKRYQAIKDMLLDLYKIKNNTDLNIGEGKLDDEHTRIMQPLIIEDEYDEDTKMQKKNFKKIILFITSLILVIIVGAVSGMVYSKFKQSTGNKDVSGKDVVIPNLLGLSQDDAKKLIEDKGLNFVIAGQEKSSKPEGTVIVTSPQEGTTVKANSDVRVIVSSGSKQATVPNLKDIDLKSAKDIISSNGFQLGKITYEFSDDTPADSILRQTPDPDTDATEKTKIDLVVSKGPEVKYADVPDLKGKSLEEAATILTNAKLVLGTKPTPIDTSDKTQDGKIANQNIAANSQRIKEGTTIDVTYFQYKDPNKLDKIEVPQFVGLTVAKAQALAVQSNLKVQISGKPEDIIIEQDPKFGTMVDKDTLIILKAQPGEQTPTTNNTQTQQSTNLTQQSKTETNTTIQDPTTSPKQ